MDRTMSKRSNI